MVCGWTLFVRNFVELARWPDGKQAEAYVKAAAIGTLGAASHLRAIHGCAFRCLFSGTAEPDSGAILLKRSSIIKRSRAFEIRRSAASA